MLSIDACSTGIIKAKQLFQKQWGEEDKEKEEEEEEEEMKKV